VLEAASDTGFVWPEQVTRLWRVSFRSAEIESNEGQWIEDHRRNNSAAASAKRRPWGVS
jgi:hypothetical protein